MSTKSEIFFSYAWGDNTEEGDDREKIVDELYQSLIDDQYNVVRDKHDLGYRGYISDFMAKIGNGKNVIVVISEKYLKSAYCMFELYEIARNSNFDKHQFSQKVFPIVIEFIDFSKPVILKEYLSYWKKQNHEWGALVKERQGELSSEQFQRYDKIKMVYQNFGKLADWIADMNTLKSTNLSNDNFNEIKQAIKNQIELSRNNEVQQPSIEVQNLEPKKNSYDKIIFISLLLIGAFFLIFFVVKPSSKSILDKTQSINVFVHGKKGKQDMILRKKGHVIMDLKGGERKKADINENGVAYFQNLHIGDSIRLEVDFSEPYKSMCPDSVFVVNGESRIYLPVALQGIDHVHGRVIYNDAPLEEVTVSIDDITAITDINGRYNIAIPEAQQKQAYKVWFNKKGFKLKSAPAYPQTGEDLIVIMEK